MLNKSPTFKRELRFNGHKFIRLKALSFIKSLIIRPKNGNYYNSHEVLKQPFRYQAPQNIIKTILT